MEKDSAGGGSSRSPLAMARRAAPRLAWLTLLVVLFRISPQSSMAVAALGTLIVFSIPWRRSWWVYVLTGRQPVETGWLAGRPPGSWQVLLDDAGPRKIQVIKEIREATGADLRSAKDIVDGVRAIAADGISGESAQELVGRLATAGASARAVPPAAGPAGEG